MVSSSYYKIFYNTGGTTCSVVTNHHSSTYSSYRRWRFCIRPYADNNYGPLIAGTDNSYKKTMQCSACPSGRTTSTPVSLDVENVCDLEPCGADSHVKNLFTKDEAKKYEGNSCTKDCEALCSTDSTCEGYTINNKVFGGFSHAGGNSYDHNGMVYGDGKMAYYLGRFNWGAMGTCGDWNGICTDYSTQNWELKLTFSANIVDVWVPSVQNTFWLLDNNKLYFSLRSNKYLELSIPPQPKTNIFDLTSNSFFVLKSINFFVMVQTKAEISPRDRSFLIIKKFTCV